MGVYRHDDKNWYMICREMTKNVCYIMEKRILFIGTYTFDNIEGVKFIVSGYNVISGVVERLLDNISHISSAIAHSNVLKEKEIEEMKEEHKNRMFRDDRPRENDLIDIDGVEHVVVRRKFKNGRVTYVLKDKNLNIIEKTI